MPKADWVALVTEPAAEYLAASELERYGLTPYLPQWQRRSTHPCLPQFRARHFPLFPRYLLLPQKQLDRNLLRACRGFSKVRPVLVNAAGVPWRAPDSIITALRLAESAGNFDETFLKGDKVRVTGSVFTDFATFIEDSTGKMVELLSPLFGGSVVRVARARIRRAE